MYEALKEAVKFCETNTDRVLKEVEQPMKILLHIFDGIFATFTDPKIDLSKQLIRLSKLNHILFHQHRAFCTAFIPGQLYHDLQRMIQGCYYACILKQKRGGGNLYLYQLGTDQLERLFGNIRTITHARNCDSLELCQRLSHAESIEAIITKHPTWKRIHERRLCGNKDYTSQTEWTGNLDASTCHVQQLWNVGQLEAAEVIGISRTYFTELSKDSGITMIRPNKRLVGVTVDDERDDEQSLNVLNEISEADIDNVASLEIEELLQDSGGYESETQPKFNFCSS